MLSISIAGHLALRLFGPRYGLVLTGFISGFVSSAVTISAMGVHAHHHPTQLPGALAGAMLSSLATVVQMALVLGAASGATLAAVAVPLLSAGATAVVLAVGFALQTLHVRQTNGAPDDSPFNFATALLLAATVATVLLGAAALHAWLGRGRVDGGGDSGRFCRFPCAGHFSGFAG